MRSKGERDEACNSDVSGAKNVACLSIWTNLEVLHDKTCSMEDTQLARAVPRRGAA